MVLVEWKSCDGTALTFNCHRFKGRQPVLIQNRHVVRAFRRLKAIGKPVCQRGRRWFVHIDIHTLHAVDRHHAQIVNAVGLVSMVMGEKNPINPFSASVQQLVAHVG